MKFRPLVCVLAGTVLLAACSNDSATGQPGSGGKSGHSGGGNNGSGGDSPGGGSGGAPGSGGKTTSDGVGGQSAGGSSGKGGAASGGAPGSGGSGLGGHAGGSQAGGSLSGGATGAGGVTGVGGKGSGGAAQGGTSGGGGVPGTGGSNPGNGGTIGTGGVTALSGTTGAGGKTAPGGTPGTGGGTSTGGAPGSGGSTGTGTSHWVGTWTASPYYDSANQPPSSLANSVLRQVVHVSLGGSQIRVQFSNLGGNGSVTINSAHVALCKATPTVDSTIDVSTDKALAFAGKATVTVAQGQDVWSDSVDFTVPNQGNITVTTAFGSVPSQVVGHSGSRTTSYLAAGSSVSDTSMTSATKFQHWYYISGIDVMADASARGVVAIGDSITDGRGTDNDKNNRWTDVLAARLQGNPATTTVSMMNQGIGATELIGTSNNAAQGRYARDVLGQSGVKYAIVYDGVNDILADKSFASMKPAYDDLISRAHAQKPDKVLVYGATIPPFGGYASYSAAREAVRQQVNSYVKGGAFDGYIDFDAALTDGGNPPKLQAAYSQWTAGNPAGSADGLHPGPAGYQKMGDTPDLTLFTK